MSRPRFMRLAAVPAPSGGALPGTTPLPGSSPSGGMPLGPALPAGTLLSTRAILASPTLSPLFLASVARAIGTNPDADMWRYDGSGVYTARRQSSGACLARGQNARAWQPGGPCAFDRIDCNWSSYVLSVPCNPRTFNEVMFQYPRFLWAKTKLQQMLALPIASGRPTRATARQYAQWCWDVCRLASVMYWATNIRDQPPGTTNPGGAPQPGAWDSYLDRSWGPHRGAWADRLNLILAGGRYGDYGQGRPRGLPAPLNLANWNAVANTSGWRRDGTFEPTTLPTSKESFNPKLTLFLDSGTGTIIDWPARWRDPIGSRTNALGVSEPIYWEAMPADPFERLVRLFELSGEAEMFVPVMTQGVVNSGGRRALDPLYHNLYFSSWGTFEYCKALAQDMLERSFAYYVATGVQRWNTALDSLPPEYRANLFGALADSTARGQMAVEASADATFGTIQAALGTVSTIAQAIPGAGQIAGLVLQLVGLLLQGLNEIFKATDSYATGAGAIPPCPPIPVVRVISGGQPCSFDFGSPASIPGATATPAGGVRVDLPPMRPAADASGGGAAKVGIGLVLLYGLSKLFGGGR